MIKKICMLLVFLLVFTITTVYPVFANSDLIIIEYYGVDACISCVKAERHINSVIERLEKDGYNIELIKYNITNRDSEKRLISLNNELNIPEKDYKVIPAVFIGHNYLIDYEGIESGFKELIIDAKTNGYNPVDLENESFILPDISIGAIMIAGLMDGINPCSIAMMLFFISIVMADIKNKRKFATLKLGLSFAFGVFVAYLGIGIGLFNFIYSFKNIQDFMFVFYFILLMMGIILFTLNLRDYYYLLKGQEKKVKNQLSKKMKKKIHEKIRKMSSKKSNGLYITAFLVAFTISFMEFFCTGQMYLPTITYMIQNSTNYSYLLMLVLYNIAFISPLVLISLLMEKGKEVIDISSELVKNLKGIKIMGALFFLLVIIYSTYQMRLLI